MPDKPLNTTPLFRSIKRAIGGAESAGDYNAKNPKKGATAKGKYQFVNDTWNYISGLHKKDYGRRLERNSRIDQEIAMDMLTEINIKSLRDNNLPVNAATVYGMHFAGNAAAVKKMLRNPSAPASYAFGADQIGYNKEILQNKTLGQVWNTLVNKVNSNGANVSPTNTKNFKTKMEDRNPLNPNYEKAQNDTEVKKNALAKAFIKKRNELLSKNDTTGLDNLYANAYKNGWIGYSKDLSRTPQGFIVDAINKYNKENKQKYETESSQKKSLLREIGGIFRDGLSPKNMMSNIPANIMKNTVIDAVTGDSANKNQELHIRDKEKYAAKLKTLIAKMKKETPKGNDVIKDAEKALASLSSSGGSGTELSRLESVQSIYNKYSATPVEFIKGKKGKPFIGNDIDYTSDGITGSPTFKFKMDDRQLNVEVPKIKENSIDQVELPSYDEDGEHGPVVDNIDSIDEGTPYSLDYDPAQVPELKDVNLHKLDISKPNNKAAQNDADARAKTHAENYSKAISDKQAKDRTLAETEKEANQDKALLDSYEFMMGGQGSKDFVDPNDIRTDIPYAKIGSSIAGMIINRNKEDEEPVLRDEELNNSLLAWVHEARRMSEMGMSPTDEANAKQSMAESYQIGIDNIVRASNGNRALVLGNQGGLNASYAKQSMELSMKDAELKQKSFEQYGRAMEIVNTFNASKDIENNKRKYDRQIERINNNAVGFASAFKTLSESLNSINKSPEEMQKMIDGQISTWGFSPYVKGDGYGSFAHYKKQKERESYKQKLDKDFTSRVPEPERLKILREISQMSEDDKLSYIDNYLYNLDNESNGGAGLTDENVGVNDSNAQKITAQSMANQEQINLENQYNVESPKQEETPVATPKMEFNSGATSLTGMPIFTPSQAVPEANATQEQQAQAETQTRDERLGFENHFKSIPKQNNILGDSVDDYLNTDIYSSVKNYLNSKA